MDERPLLAVGPAKLHRRSLQSYGTLVAVLQTSLLAMLVTSVNGVAAIVTVRLRVLARFGRIITSFCESTGDSQGRI